MNIFKSKQCSYKDLFDYKIIYSRKRRRSMCLSLGDGEVVVRVPVLASSRKILDFISSKERWILERLKKIPKVLKTGFIEGSEVYYLGDKYFIKIIESGLLKSGGFCELVGENFLVHVPLGVGKESGEISDIVESWFENQAERIFTEKVKYLAEKHDFQYNKIRTKKQKTLLGSCSVQNNLNFNWKVIQCSPKVIEYLVVHELVHTVHRDHSKRFWNMVGQILPDYKSLKRELSELRFFSVF